MLLAVAVLEDVRPEHMTLAEFVVALRVVGGTVVALVVLEDRDDVVVAAHHPAAVEKILVDRVVIAQPPVKGEGILLEFGAVELARVDREA